MMEEWKNIPGYEGKYFISSFGRLMNNKGLIMKPMKCSNGYLTACLWLNNVQQKILIHRLVANAFIPNPNNLNEVNHIDEDKENNQYTNLEWCTHLYNMNYGNVGKKISQSTKGRKPTLEQRLKCRSALGKKWMNNPSKEILVKEEEIPSFILQGYNLGRKKIYV